MNENQNERQKCVAENNTTQVNILIRAHKNVAKAISHATLLKYGFGA